MEIDGDPEVLSISIPLRHALDSLDLRIQRLRFGIGDPMAQISQEIRKVAFDRLGGIDERLQT
jgi:hypothetical protein